MGLGLPDILYEKLRVQGIEAQERQGVHPHHLGFLSTCQGEEPKSSQAEH